MSRIKTHLQSSANAARDLAEHHAATLQDIAHVTGRQLANGYKLLLCGNGGSAADAQHIAAEFMVRYKHDRKPIPAIALTTDTSVLTATANDFSFNEVFSRQVAALGHSGDVLWAFTTSGLSPNVRNAVHVANERGMYVIVFTSKTAADLHPHIALAVGETTAQAQELHMIAAHAICDEIEARAITAYPVPPKGRL